MNIRAWNKADTDTLIKYELEVHERIQNIPLSEIQ